MPETQLGSMRLGSVDMLDEEREGKTGVAPLIHIADGQSDEILGDIAPEHIIDDTHRQSLEDTLETYEFYTFGDQSFTQHLKDRNRIIIPDEDGTLREFIIYESEKYRDTEGYKMYVIGTASYLDLKKASVIRPGSFTGTASQHIGIALNDTEWRPGIVEVSGSRTIHRDDFTNPFDYLKTLAREFEGELRFRIEHNGNRITGRFVDLLERIGEWRGREIEFGKDLDGIRRIENTERIVTALIGLGPEREDGTRLEVFVEDTEALQRWGRPDPVTGELRHLIEVYEPESEREDMTEAELRQYTQTELNKRINAVVTYECSVVDLENVPGMENKQIRFGDTIKIKDTKFNPPLYIEARVYEQERSIKSKAKKNIKLGDFIEFTEDEVQAIWRQLQREVKKRITAAELREYAEPKKVESSTPPPINSEGDNPIWVDTSQEPYIPYVANVENNEWVRMTLSDDDVLVNEVNYNGLKWSKDEGLIVERSDGKVRSILNGTDGIKVQQKDVNDNWADVFFVDSQGNVKFSGTLDGANGVFSGDINASNIYGSTIQGSQFISQSSYDDFGRYEFIVLDDKHLEITKIGVDTVVYGSAKYHSTGIDYQSSLAFPNFVINSNVSITDDLHVSGDLKILGNISKSEWNTLWQGESYPNGATTIYPNKPLSECLTGWVLVWSYYDASSGQPGDYRFVLSYVHKNHARDAAGLSTFFPVPLSTAGQIAVKTLYISDDRIVGHDDNMSTLNRAAVLRRIYEY